MQAILGPGSAIEVPYLVTEIEHSIINLRPNPPASILLLGRSGTGKTTVLVYRMWAEFKVYWEGARRTTTNSDGGEDVWYEQNVPPVQAVGGTEAAVDHDEAEEDDSYRHLHMLFITRNPVLRHQVGAQ